VRITAYIKPPQLHTREPEFKNQLGGYMLSLTRALRPSLDAG